MNLSKLVITIVLVIGSALLSADKYAGEIYQLGMDVENAALGNTGITNQNSAALAYWNSSLLTKAGNTKFEIMHAEEYAGLMNYDTIAAVWGSNEQKYSLAAYRIGIDDIPLTQKINPEDSLYSDNIEQYDSVDNADYIVYFGMGRTFNEKYHIGFSPKFAFRQLAEEYGYAIGLDLSSHYALNENVLFGLRARDIFTTQTFWSTGTNETVNPGFDLETNLGFKMPVFDSNSNFIFRLEENNENIEEGALFSLGVMSFDIHAGLKTELHKYLDLLVGYDREFFTAGTSINIKQFKLQYAFKNNSELDNSHRISLKMSL